MTSVKDFRVSEPATSESLGRGRFVFTDAYSVFDWGRMPDPIPEKGASLCTMGAYNFELLEANGIATHYRGVVDGGGEVTSLSTVEGAPTEMAIDLTQVPELPYEGAKAGYDYTSFHDAGGENYLIPLEIVFRNRVPVGSSLRKRIMPADIGLEHESWPEEPIELPEPVVEFSTKYERQDRYLSSEEADRIAGIADIDELETVARSVNEVITERAGERGFLHEDGKIECLYFDGEIRVADVVGTFDENRFAYGGTQLSKEVIRQWYKRNQPAWVEAVAEAKREVRGRETDDWRGLCDVSPTTLPDDVIGTVSAMYAAGTNAYTGEKRFDAPGITAALEAVSRL
ncbi:phosphoribosylaminoimidazolesuccinocarboxamide synthase [Halorubrum vacuolatum]|uniref:Phosphoribosylaminoimidazole-succinocarboxamide synthase n=1 Tax=Halorubrum vacuolatum TaxID=63740 RepID=A0A238WM29_HALVU|nr:phosphoribosylaminoimidazolesuccinocarboxamide synthase [Halorubrum vacuolatum]SNR47636.1 phosphoribosylaminoimidazole-succinocarboxamide synthase [Halorubrum vacuolatum]